MDKSPLEPSGQKCQRRQEIIVALLCHGPSDREQENGVTGVAAVILLRAGRCHRKLLEVEAVIAQRNRILARRQARKMVAAGFGAGHCPSCFGELYSLLPY